MFRPSMTYLPSGVRLSPWHCFGPVGCAPKAIRYSFRTSAPHIKIKRRFPFSTTILSAYPAKLEPRRVAKRLTITAERFSVCTMSLVSGSIHTSRREWCRLFCDRLFETPDRLLKVHGSTQINIRRNGLVYQTSGVQWVQLQVRVNSCDPYRSQN